VSFQIFTDSILLLMNVWMNKRSQ